MKQLSSKKKKKHYQDSITDSISFVIKGQLTAMKSTIKREMRYKRTASIIGKRGTRKEVQECRLEDKINLGCGAKEEGEAVPKKRGRKSTKVEGETAKKPSKVKTEEGAQKVPKKRGGRPKRVEETKKDVEGAVKRGRKSKTESPIKKDSKSQSAGLKKAAAKILRETTKPAKPAKIKKLTANVKAMKKVKAVTKMVKSKIKQVGKKKVEEVKEEKVEVKEEPAEDSSATKGIAVTSPLMEVKKEESVKGEEEEEEDIKPEVKPEIKKKPGRKPNVQKLKYKPKTVLVKKPIISKTKTKTKEKEPPKKHKMKLMSLWNGPKRHRVASLNALAKVHCLYENESRSAILDNLDAVKSETEPSSDDSPREVEPSTRTLRSVPGLRAVGKHWDMDEGSFSSSDESSCDSMEKAVVMQKPKASEADSDSTKSGEGSGRKRRRNRTEIIMDLKDMVVRKRMASLNATAILAASYSLERRSLKSPRCEDTDEDSEDGVRKAKEKKRPQEEAEKNKDEEKNVIEVCATPNKKVSVILNQDTDVTITGVYVNSTTRSTHHEGYCSIAGMQYRISATSHTQTAATAVATETILQPSGNGAGQDNVSKRREANRKRSLCFAVWEAFYYLEFLRVVFFAYYLPFEGGFLIVMRITVA